MRAIGRDGQFDLFIMCSPLSKYQRPTLQDDKLVDILAGTNLPVQPSGYSKKHALLSEAFPVVRRPVRDTSLSTRQPHLEAKTEKFTCV